MADVLTEKERLETEYESLKDVREVYDRLEQQFQVYACQTNEGEVQIQVHTHQDESFHDMKWQCHLARCIRFNSEKFQSELPRERECR